MKTITGLGLPLSLISGGGERRRWWRRQKDRLEDRLKATARNAISIQKEALFKYMLGTLISV